MIWRFQGGSNTGFGSPPPYRPYYPYNGDTKIWTRTRVKSYFNGSLDYDSDWSDYAEGYNWPAGGFSRNVIGGDTLSNIIYIETAGKWMPWQLVINNRTDTFLTGAVAYNIEDPVDMTPGDVIEFHYDVPAAGKQFQFWGCHVLIPAEGVDD